MPRLPPPSDQLGNTQPFTVRVCACVRTCTALLCVCVFARTLVICGFDVLFVCVCDSEDSQKVKLRRCCGGLRRRREKKVPRRPLSGARSKRIKSPDLKSAKLFCFFHFKLLLDLVASSKSPH